MLQPWVQGGCCPSARSSQFPQVAEGAGGVRSAGREPVGMMQPSLVFQGCNPRLWCYLYFGTEARSLALCKPRWTGWLCACCRWVLALTSRGSVCLDTAILWDVTCPSLFSPALWGQTLKQLPNGAYMYFALVASRIVWAELWRKPCVSQLTGCKAKSCNFGGRFYFVSHEGNLAFCKSVQNSSCFIWINEVCSLISCLLLLKAFLITKTPKSFIFIKTWILRRFYDEFWES